MTKLKTTIICCTLIAALAVFAATTKVLIASAPGTRTVNTINVGKPIHLEAIGCLPANGTVVISRVTGATTNTLASVSLTNGAYNASIDATNYVVAGDTLIFGGTYTSGVVRVIMQAD